jgi:hypothetical protein
MALLDKYERIKLIGEGYFSNVQLYGKLKFLSF